MNSIICLDEYGEIELWNFMHELKFILVEKQVHIATINKKEIYISSTTIINVNSLNKDELEMIEYLIEIKSIGEL